MRITKVYTKTGDTGQTSLVGGTRVSKASLRVEAYGEVDELNSVIGMVRIETPNVSDVDQLLATIQNDLFTLGADLASPSDIDVPRIDETFIANLEGSADKFLGELEPLREFVIPGGTKAGALLHFARTVARRAERRVVSLSEAESINGDAIVYLNRLSDLLFILARVANHRASVSETMTDFSKRGK